MRLFGKIDSAINRFDRAWLLTMPFDLSSNLADFIEGPYYVAASGIYLGGVGLAQSHVPGLTSGGGRVAGGDVASWHGPGSIKSGSSIGGSEAAGV